MTCSSQASASKASPKVCKIDLAPQDSEKRATARTGEPVPPRSGPDGQAAVVQDDESLIKPIIEMSRMAQNLLTPVMHGRPDVLA